MPKVVINPLWRDALYEMRYEPSQGLDSYPRRFLTEEDLRQAHRALLERDWKKLDKVSVNPFLMI